MCVCVFGRLQAAFGLLANNVCVVQEQTVVFAGKLCPGIYLFFFPKVVII